MHGMTRLKCTPELWQDRAMPILRTLVATAAAAALLVGAAPAPAAAGDPAFRSCRQVNFTPNSDDVAASVRVKDVRCWYARRFIRETDGHPGDTHRGFACRSWNGPDEGLAHTIHRCARGAKVIRWKRF
jgi:hypothetical protein